MSQSEDTQADLADFRSDTDNRPAWNPKPDEDPDTGAREACQSCGGSVTRQFAKVFGDNNDEVDHCLECSTFREIHGGSQI